MKSISELASSLCSVFIPLSSIFISDHAIALTYGEAKEIAEALPIQLLNSTDHGKLCEIIGTKVLKDLRPNAEILNGVIYKNKSRIIGELDLVALENGVVTDVIEVKCMASYSSASNKADEQLDRFSGYIGRCDVDFSIEGTKVPCSVFGNNEIRLGKMSYTDARSYGFNYDLNLSRKQVLQLIKEAKESHSD